MRQAKGKSTRTRRRVNPPEGQPAAGPARGTARVRHHRMGGEGHLEMSEARPLAKDALCPTLTGSVISGGKLPFNPLNTLLGLFSHDVAIDLGTANTLVMVRGRGIVIDEPSVVAIDRVNKKILAIGSEAARRSRNARTKPCLPIPEVPSAYRL